MKYPVLLICFFFVLMTGCLKTEEDTALIKDTNVYLEISYDEQENCTIARAIFIKGSSRVRVTDVENISCNDTILPYNKNFDQFDHSFNHRIDTGTFKIITKTGLVYNAAAIIKPIELLVSSPDTIDVSNDLILRWSGDKVGADETVALYFKNYYTNYVSAYTTTSLFATSITVDHKELSYLGAGAFYMFFARYTTKESTVVNPGLKTYINTYFFSTEKTVTLK